jgi:hypothetical protein
VAGHRQAALDHDGHTLIHECEQAIRDDDPWISCTAHFLDLAYRRQRRSGGPFDAAVVEVCWFGNRLLSTVDPVVLSAHLADRFEARAGRGLVDLTTLARLGAMAYHNFRTEAMLAYHSGACDGSPAYEANCSHGRAMTISVVTSTATPTIIAYLTRKAKHGLPRGAAPGERVEQSRVDDPVMAAISPPWTAKPASRRHVPLDRVDGIGLVPAT